MIKKIILFFLLCLTTQPIFAQNLAVGSQHTLAIRSDGSLWAWGDNKDGQLGVGDYISTYDPKRIGNSNDWKKVFAASYDVYQGLIYKTVCFAIKNDGSLWTWGNKTATPIRQGSSNDWETIAIGINHTLAIKTDGSLWAWGTNTNGVFGDGMTDGSSMYPIRIGTDTNWKSISAGLSYISAIKTDGSLWSWGNGNLGLSNTTTSNIPLRIGNANDWKTVSAGLSHTLAIKNDGSLWAWGKNSQGQLGDITTIDKNVPTRIGNASDWELISAGESFSSAIKKDGSLWTWGYNASGQLGNPGSTRKIEPIQIGIDYRVVAAMTKTTRAIKNDGSLWVWGAWTDPYNDPYHSPKDFNFPLFTLPPTGQATQTLCDQSTLSALSVNGNAIQWYETATGGQALASTTKLENNRAYYASQSNYGLESTTRFGVTVTILPMPTASITASGPTAFCSNVSVTLTANSGSSYLWSTGATTRSILVNTPGNYTVKVTNANGCSATSAVTSVTLSSPSASITASGSTTLCQGGKVTLTASEGSSYLWSNGATTRSIEVSTGGNYTVLVTNANGCSARSLATIVTVTQLPNLFISTSGPTTFCAGDAVLLTASTDGTYLWSNGATTKSINASISGNYTVMVTYANGCSATSPAIAVTVNQVAATITPSGSTIFCQGGKVTLTSNEGSSYLWSTGATTRSIEVSNSGNYTVRVTNSNGCSVTSAATGVTVNTLPSANISVSGPLTISQTGNVVLSANTGSGLNYQWIRNGVAINAATTNSYTATTAGSYTVKVTNSSGCEAVSAATVVKTLFVLPANNFQISIAGETCRSSDNGRIDITSLQNFNYTATLSKAGQTVKSSSFTNNAALTGLSAGNYTLCITVAGQSEYKQCYDVVITEPQDLSVYSYADQGNNLVKLLMSGGDDYYITINGQHYTSRTANISLPLKKGMNSITVRTSRECQGVFTENLFVDGGSQLYPNPFTSTLNIRIDGRERQDVFLKVLNSSGFIVHQSTYRVNYGQLSVDLGRLDKGYYYIVIDKQTYKVIKE